MFNATDSRKPISNLEHLIMETVWELGPSTAEQVRKRLEDERPLKESTVRTLLRRLEEKGYLNHTLEGRTYIYQGVEAPRNVAASAVRQIIDRFCGGSLEQLLVGMVDQEIVDENELKDLARRIAERKQAKEESK